MPPGLVWTKWKLLKGCHRDLYVFLCGAQLILRSSILTVIDLNEVNVTMKNAGTSSLVLSGEGDSANGWRCC